MPDYMLHVIFDDGKDILYDVKDDIQALEGYKDLESITGLFQQAQLDHSRTCVFWIMINISKTNATTVVKGMGMIIWFMKKIKGNETNRNHTHRKTTDFLWNY